jgi:hypothetical protein
VIDPWYALRIAIKLNGRDTEGCHNNGREKGAAPSSGIAVLALLLSTSRLAGCRGIAAEDCIGGEEAERVSIE